MNWLRFFSALKGILEERGISLEIPITWTGWKKKEPPNVSQRTYFSDEEVSGLDGELAAKLDMARGKAGIPFVITCGLRTPEHNAALKGAVSDSAHLPNAEGKSLAADIACNDDHSLFLMLKGLIVAGFTRIGIYLKADDAGRWIPVHLHVDCDATKPPEVTWILMEAN